MPVPCPQPLLRFADSALPLDPYTFTGSKGAIRAGAASSARNALMAGWLHAGECSRAGIAKRAANRWAGQSICATTRNVHTKRVT